jgi:RNA recognition motif-containing protein
MSKGFYNYYEMILIFTKDYSEEDLKSNFERFPCLEYVSLMKNKQSGESKGCGYAKFSKASAAAYAMEQINEESFQSNNIIPFILISHLLLRWL